MPRRGSESYSSTTYDYLIKIGFRPSFGNYWATKEGDVIKVREEEDGTVNVLLCKRSYVNGYVIYAGNAYEHQIVAWAFLGPCPVGKEVNHIDHNRKNNHIENLEYVTHSENLLKRAKT